MRYIVTDTGYLVDTGMYGYDTAGSNNQDGIRVVDNKVYLTYWSAGNDWVEDTYDLTFLGNIVYQSNKRIDILDPDNYGKNPITGEDEPE